MKRVIVDYSKLTTDILDLLVEKYPEGYEYSDIIKFQNAKQETISAVEVRTDETIYLVKISNQLEKTMEDYSEDEDSFDAGALDFDDNF
jgi:DNA-directed RNA polymerase subunit delta